MQRERLFWQVCVDDEGYWSCIEPCLSESHAKAVLEKARKTIPEAFVVKVSMTRVASGRSNPKRPLRVVHGGRDGGAESQ